MNKNNNLDLSNVRRRLLVAGTSLAALAWANSMRAQAKPPLVIGWLHSGAREQSIHLINAFHEGMAALGWKAGAQYVLEERWADGRMERLPALAQELVAKKPAVIVATPATTARIAAKAAPATPVVVATGDPLMTGLVKSLARPGGMITGLSNVNAEINVKLLELLFEALPKLRRVGFLADASSLNMHDYIVSNVRRVAERYRVEASIADAAKPEDIGPAMARLAKDKVQALVVLSSPWFTTYRQQIMKLALAQRWPVAVGVNVYAAQGALLSYSADRPSMFRRSAYYVDRILKGTKPADLPIEQPMKFEFVLNMKTAKVLGIAIPQSILLQATRVIE